MGAKNLGQSKFLNTLLKPAGWVMESRLRKLFQNPVRILQGADIRPGQTVLEVGSGTGFFTIAAGHMLGEQGHLIAMEPLSAYAERLREKSRASGLSNIEVVREDALDTGLADSSIDKALLFGVVPFPSLPLSRLLPEMHRVLKSDGTLSVWLFPVSGIVPAIIRRSGYFSGQSKRNGVYNYQKLSTAN